MNQLQPPSRGAIMWCDLTVADAERVRDFYQAVVGWTASEVPMGGYSDYCMNQPAGSVPVAALFEPAPGR